MQISQEKLKEWVEIYLKHVRDVTVDVHVHEEEGYKFRAVDTFQRHFNLEATNLHQMLDESIENNNLVVGAQYFPKKAILYFAEKYPDDVRAVLHLLADTSISIEKRITEASDLIEKINEKRNKDEGMEYHTYIKVRFLSLLLGYLYPNDVNALKATEWKVYCRFIEPEFRMPNHTTPGDQYHIYGEYIEPLRQYLKTLPEIKEIKDKLTEGLGFKDDEYRWITQDVIFVTARVFAGIRAEELVVHEQIDDTPQEEASLSRTEAVDLGEASGFMPLEEYLEEYIVRNWDTINFGEKLELYRDEDGVPGQQYTTDVGVIDILAKDVNNNFVVIELKRAESGYKVVGQVLNYMGWVLDKLAQDNQKIRGLIIVGKADKTLQSAIRPVADKIKLLEYRVAITLTELRSL